MEKYDLIHNGTRYIRKVPLVMKPRSKKADKPTEVVKHIEDEARINNESPTKSEPDKKSYIAVVKAKLNMMEVLQAMKRDDIKITYENISKEYGLTSSEISQWKKLNANNKRLYQKYSKS